MLSVLADMKTSWFKKHNAETDCVLGVTYMVIIKYCAISVITADISTSGLFTS